MEGLFTFILEPCEQQSFKTVPIISGMPIDEYECKPGKPCIFIRPVMGSREVTYYTKSYLVSFNDLVSSVGGGLGLFVGFSILSTLTAFLDYALGKGK